jgi:hypothetical protein
MISANETPRAAARLLAATAIAQGFKPEALHEYREPDGTLIYWRIRAKRDDGEKWLRPMMVNGHGYELREPDFPAGRKPIYNLDKIAANTSAPVYVVEGEKAADALTKVGAIATTSGGAKSAGDADWTPLAGRRCILWPDNDEAGKGYAGEVGNVLAAMDCPLSCVDVAKLDLPPKGDAWDWLQSHQNASLGDLKGLPLLAYQLSAENATATDLASVELQRADSITPEAVTWFWRDWIAAGKLHILAGPPGTGKTTVAIGIAATLTSAGRWPDGSRCGRRKRVIIWTGEDGLADTLIPRLLANGADMSRVHFVGAVTIAGERREFDPATDVPLLARHAGELADVGLMIVDPIVSAVSGDAHKSNDVRRGLQPLAHLAAQTGAAIVGISHFSKGTSNRDPVERVTGSIAFGAAARIVLGAAKRRDDQGGGRILVRAKSNVGPDTGGFVYDLQQVPVPGHPDILASRLTWGEALEGTARALLADVETDEGEDERNALADAKSFLQGLLADGPVPSKTAWADAEQAGHARATVRRAMTALGVDARKTSLQGGWVWELPPKMLKTPEDAHAGKVSTFGDDERLREDAHSKRMNTFGPDEHLRADDAPFVEEF